MVSFTSAVYARIRCAVVWDFAQPRLTEVRETRLHRDKSLKSRILMHSYGKRIMGKIGWS